MAVQKVLLLWCFLCVATGVNAASKDEILHTSLYRLAEGHIKKNDASRPLPILPTIKTTTQTISTRATTSKPTIKTTTQAISTRATTFKPVYIPPSSTVKPTTKSTIKKVVEETTKSTAEQPVITREPDHALLDTKTNSNHTNNGINESNVFVGEKKEHVKSEPNPKHEVTAHTAIKPAEQKEPHQNEIAEEKSGLFSSALIPFAASIGTALAIGGLAFYAYPAPPVRSRSDRIDHGSFDNGARVVQSSDLTPQEIRRLMNAEAYHGNARSSTDEKKPHPYIDLAKRVIQYATPVYQYIVPSFLGGNSDEEDTGDEYDIGSLQSKQHAFAGPGYGNRVIQPIYNGGHQNIGQHVVGQPNIGQHVLGQPNIGQHIFGQPNIGQHVIGQPSDGQHFHTQPNVGQHILGQQNIGQPNIGQHIFGQPNAGQHVIGPQNIVQPNVGELHYNN